TNWQTVNQKIMDPKAMSGAYKEWMDIQSASVDVLGNGNTQFLKTTLSAGTLFADVAQNGSSPQHVWASYLNIGVNLLKEYQADLNDQAQHFNAIQAAYKAWFQKTFLQSD